MQEARCRRDDIFPPQRKSPPKPNPCAQPLPRRPYPADIIMGYSIILQQETKLSLPVFHDEMELRLLGFSFEQLGLRWMDGEREGRKKGGRGHIYL